MAGCTPIRFPGGSAPEGGCIVSSSFKGGCKIQLPEVGHTLSPWVRAKLIAGKGSGTEITVGNNSAEALNHTAVITSFDFGQEDGFSCNLTIHDQAGSSFVQFMENILKDIKCADKGAISLEVQWGWVKAGCKTPLPNAYSPCHNFMIHGVETSNSDGKFMYEITGKDLGTKMPEGAVDKIYGSDEQPITLKAALQKLMTEDPTPKVGTIKFLRVKDGGVEQVKFSPKYDSGDSKGEGPKCKWIANGQDKLQIAATWLKGWLSDNDKPFQPGYNSENKEGEIIFWEVNPSDCQSEQNYDTTCIGFYIVNGGKSSPVLDFSPKIAWRHDLLTTSGGQISSESVSPTPEAKAQGDKKCNTLSRPQLENGGQTISTPPTECHKNLFGKEATKEAQEANAKYAKSMKLSYYPIEADLVIIGDPTMLPPSKGMNTRNVGIAYVNPFHIIGSKVATSFGNNDVGSCGEWLALPTCNEVLSNKAWLIRKISHSIREGSYTTTLRLYLQAPGIDKDSGTSLGWSGGWQPPAGCPSSSG